jgi:hypothetical protein
MKLLNLALAFTTLLAVSAGVTANPGTELRATAQQRMDLEGTYQLDNGQRARVFELDQKLYVELGRHRKELVLVAPNRFGSRDGAISLQFQPEAPGERIVLGYRRGDIQAMPVMLASGQRQRHGRGSAD